MDFYTNNPEVDKYIEARIESLPKELSGALSNEKLFTDIATHLKEQGIQDEDIQKVQYEIFLVLIQLVPVGEFELELVTETNLSVETAMHVTEYVQRKIFEGLRTHLEHLPDEENTNGVAVKLKERLELRPEGVNVFQHEEKKDEKVETTTKQHDDLKGEDEAKPLTKEELHSSLSISRTMAKDIASARGEAPPEIKKETTVPDKNIPRYAKPLTDLPNYNEHKED
jgi:hypothetical protein